MGLILGIETDTGQRPPYSYSDFLKHQLLTFGHPDMPLTRFAEQFPVNLDLLTGDKIVGLEDEPLEKFIARDPDNKDRAKFWHEEQERREAAWQSPHTVINTIKPLITILDSNPPFISDMLTDERNFAYFKEGYFRKDLEELMKALEWCTGNNIKKIRLVLR